MVGAQEVSKSSLMSCAAANSKVSFSHALQSSSLFRAGNNEGLRLMPFLKSCVSSLLCADEVVVTAGAVLRGHTQLSLVCLEERKAWCSSPVRLSHLSAGTGPVA